MLYVLLIIAAVIAVVLSLRIRLRVSVTRERQLIFAGLGRSGPEYDFATKEATIKLFGLKIKTIQPGTRGEKKKKVAEKPRPEKKRKKKTPRQRPIGDILKIVPGVGRAMWRYAVSLLKGIVVEELEGEIDGGFYSPDMTGIAYGYYEAALAAMPGVAGRFRFRPDWNGPAFDGSMRATFAIPLYRLVWRTLVLVGGLPLRDILKVAIGKKKGDSDGQ